MAAAYGRNLGSATEDGVDNNAVITVAGAANVGEKIIVAASALDDTTLTVADSGLNSYTVTRFRSASSFETIWLAWADVTTALTNGVSTITGTWGTIPTWATVAAHAITGAATGAPADTQTFGDFTDAWDTPDSVTANGAIVVGCAGFRSADAPVGHTAVRGIERTDTNSGSIQLVVLSNEFAVGSASSDVAGQFASPAGVGVTCMHYAIAVGAASVTGVSNRFLIRHSRMTSW